jgi:LacI family transcriptional regulator
MTGERRQAGPPTIPDVARRAGVSSATAGRALGGYGYTSEETRRRVLEAADALGYRRNEIARSMATGRTFTIGVVIADIENPFFASATRAISDAARREGFNVILANTDEDLAAEIASVRLFLDKRVDGMIVAPTSSIETAHLARARDAGCPIVLLDRRIPALGVDTIAVDNFSAAREAVAALIGDGHACIALASNAPAHEDRHLLISSIRERIDGYRAALIEGGLPVSEAAVMLGGWNAEAAERRLAVLRDPALRPTAVLATDNRVALGVLHLARRAGLSLPRQLSLIAFDDAEWADAVSPPLSVIGQPVRELGTEAAEMLIARIRGAETGAPQERLLRARLVMRGSTAPPPRRTRAPGNGRARARASAADRP